MFKAGLFSILSYSITKDLLIEFDGSTDAIMKSEVISILFDYLIVVLPKHIIITNMIIKMESN